MAKTMSLGRIPGAHAAGGTGRADMPNMGPRPWAAYPGSGGPNQMLKQPYGNGPQWRLNTITNPVVTPQQPQNLQRVFNGGVPFAQNPVGANSGLPIRGLLAGLGAHQEMISNPSTNKTFFTMGLGKVGRLGQGEAVATPLDAIQDPEMIKPCTEGFEFNGTFVSRADTWKARSWMLSAAGAAVGAYHGYHRNRKGLGAAAGWGIAGYFFAPIVIGVALVQGVGKAK